MQRMTRFERTRLISARSLQLALGAPPLVKPTDNSTPYDLAKEEFEKAILPLSVIRRFPDGTTERIELQ